MTDEELEKYAELIVANVELRQAIRRHRDARGHDRCWQNDLELYRVLGEPLPSSAEMPDYEDFMEKCNEYYYQQKWCGHDSLGKG